MYTRMSRWRRTRPTTGQALTSPLLMCRGVTVGGNAVVYKCCNNFILGGFIDLQKKCFFLSVTKIA